MKEYKTVLLDNFPDPLVNRLATEGWRVLTVTVGGFDRQGEHHPVATVVWLERERADMPADPPPLRLGVPKAKQKPKPKLKGANHAEV